jgi:hypothetical protein
LTFYAQVHHPTPARQPSLAINERAKTSYTWTVEDGDPWYDQSRLLLVPRHLVHLVSLPPRSFALLLQLWWWCCCLVPGGNPHLFMFTQSGVVQYASRKPCASNLCESGRHWMVEGPLSSHPPLRRHARAPIVFGVWCVWYFYCGVWATWVVLVF